MTTACGQNDGELEHNGEWHSATKTAMVQVISKQQKSEKLLLAAYFLSFRWPEIP